MRNVTPQVEVNTTGNYTTVQRNGYKKASSLGGWLTSLIIIPLGFLWGLARSLALAAGGLIGLGLIALGAWYSVENTHYLMWFRPLRDSILNVTAYPNYWLLLTALIVTGAIELWQSKGMQELKRAKLLKKTGAGKGNAGKLTLGGLAFVAEFASLIAGFWQRGGFDDPRNWVIILLAVFGVKVGYAMVSEFAKERKSSNESASEGA